MSNMVVVDIHTFQNEVLAGSQIPDDYSIQEIIDELVDELGLPRLDENGSSIGYSMYSITSNKDLASNSFVRDSIRSGDAIRLSAKSNGAMPPKRDDLPPTRWEPPPNSVRSNEVAVILSVLDLNKSEQVMLVANRPVGELIRHIVASYDLPPRDKLGQIIKYKLQSKALGRFLSETSTLGQEEVPMLDRLTLHREETAGAQKNN